MKKYYAVKWGKGSGTLRISKKVEGVIQACINCFGTTDPKMMVKDLGTNKRAIQTEKIFRTLIKEPKGWINPFNPFRN